MKKAQTKIGLVLLAIVSIIALVGLILMFTQPGATPYSIGIPYGPQPGIAQTVPAYPTYPGAPTQQYPAGEIPIVSIGGEVPVLVLFKGQWATISEMGLCLADLQPYYAAFEDAVSCYVVPTTGVAVEVVGWYLPSTSWKGRLPNEAFNYGGDIYCFLNTPYDRDAFAERILGLFKDKPDKWTQAQGPNGEKIAMCNADYEPRPQGLKYY
jgi:hypothetical protein